MQRGCSMNWNKPCFFTLNIEPYEKMDTHLSIGIILNFQWIRAGKNRGAIKRIR